MTLHLPSGTVEGVWRTREAWLKARRAGIGGSDIGAILGMSTYTSALEVYYSKVEETPEREPTEVMEIGRDIEAWILEEWSKRSDTGDVSIDSRLITIRSNQFPFLIHSPDALMVDNEPVNGDPLVLGGVEVKNVRSDAGWNDDDTQGLPPFYYAQVQHGLLCSGLPTWTVVALVAGQKIITRQIVPDKEVMGTIALEAERFWTAHVLPKVPPAPDGSESAGNVLRDRWKASVDASVAIDGELWEKYKGAREMVAFWESTKKEAEQRIQALMGDNEIATVGGEKVATWKVSTRTTIDSKRLKEQEPSMAKKYSKTSHTRTFRPVA